MTWRPGCWHTIFLNRFGIMISGTLAEGNIFDPDAEHITTLIETAQLEIQKIVTSGQKSPDDFWYDQECDEFVVVMQGSAVIALEDQQLQLQAGDFLYIKAHERHQILSSDPNKVTVWLAIFVK